MHKAIDCATVFLPIFLYVWAGVHRMQSREEELQGVLARWSGALRVRCFSFVPYHSLSFWVRNSIAQSCSKWGHQLLLNGLYKAMPYQFDFSVSKIWFGVLFLQNRKGIISRFQIFAYQNLCIEQNSKGQRWTFDVLSLPCWSHFQVRKICETENQNGIA